MTAIIIGISSGVLVVSTIGILKQLNKQVVYALILSGIGFLYAGFTWMDRGAFILTAVQSLLFLFMAVYGVKNSLLLASGYFLHGIWDLVFGLFPYSKLIPPHYDLFCLSFDFMIGFYLVSIRYLYK